ncbi:MAG: four helix bundle protein [Patescibacteria group bacterium]|nr:four helix bundle protein [Patescibacteria group bacterium]
MNQTASSKSYDLEERTLGFAKRVRDYVRKLPKTISNFEYAKQLIRSSGSQAANYIEANESLSKKDFIFRVKISKKETKESLLWVRLTEPTKSQEAEKEYLLREAGELIRIFGAIEHKISTKS